MHTLRVALADKICATRAAEFFAERGQGADAARAVRFLEGRPEG